MISTSNVVNRMSVSVVDADAAVADVLSSKTFYAGTAAKKTGTMADKSAAGTVITPSTVDQTLPASGYWTGQAASFKVSGDADLVGNKIKSGENIFDVAGTYVSTSAYDIEGDAHGVVWLNGGGATTAYSAQSITAGADLDIVSLTQSYTAGGLAVAAGYVAGYASVANQLKARLYMNGVQAAESAFIAAGDVSTFADVSVSGYSSAMDGNMVVKLSIHNYDVADRLITLLLVANPGNQKAALYLFAGGSKIQV